MTTQMPTLTADLNTLPTETLLSEISRLQNSINHLARSNDEIKEFDPQLNDSDLKQAVLENEQVVSRQQEQMDALIELIRQRLGDDAAREIQSTVEEYRKKDQDLINGHVSQ
ncbi:hypothetical protein Unana1_01310 [Umbelopsis nana]